MSLRSLAPLSIGASAILGAAPAPALSSPSTARESSALLGAATTESAPAAAAADDAEKHGKKRKAEGEAAREAASTEETEEAPYRPRLGLSVSVPSAETVERTFMKAKRRKGTPDPIVEARVKYSIALCDCYRHLQAMSASDSNVIVVKRTMSERMTGLLTRVRTAIAGQNNEAGLGLQPLGKRTNVFRVNVFNSTTQKVETIAIFKLGGRGAEHEEREGVDFSKDGVRKEDEARNEVIVAGLEGLSLDTMFVKLSPTMCGMLQEYVPDARNFNDLSADERNGVIASYPVQDFQKLAITDIKFFNTDRNRGNLLYVNRSGIQSVHLIDHALILPRGFESSGVFYWANWAQAQRSFTTESLAQIAAMNFEEDATAILTQFPNYSKESIEIMDFCYHLLKEGAKKGLTPFQIACFQIGRPQNFLGLLYQRARIACSGDPVLVNRCVKAEIDKAITRMVSIYAQAVENATAAQSSSSSSSSSASNPTEILFKEIGKLIPLPSIESLGASYASSGSSGGAVASVSIAAAEPSSPSSPVIRVGSPIPLSSGGLSLATLAVGVPSHSGSTGHSLPPPLPSAVRVDSPGRAASGGSSVSLGSPSHSGSMVHSLPPPPPLPSAVRVDSPKHAASGGSSVRLGSPGHSGSMVHSLPPPPPLSSAVRVDSPRRAASGGSSSRGGSPSHSVSGGHSSLPAPPLPSAVRVDSPRRVASGGSSSRGGSPSHSVSGGLSSVALSAKKGSLSSLASADALVSPRGRGPSTRVRSPALSVLLAASPSDPLALR